MKIWVLVLIGVAFFCLYVRFAPSNPANWHVAPPLGTNGDTQRSASFLARRSVDLSALDAIILQTPRTRLLAGSVKMSHITYITRSKYFGFPDYTTVYRDGDDVVIFGRLRYGIGDYSVNKTRILGWLEALATPAAQG